MTGTRFQKYYQQNKARLLTYKAQWRKANREHCRKYSLEYHRTHKKQDKLTNQICRKRIKESEPWKNHRRYARGRCYCKTNHNYRAYGGRGIKCLLTVEEVRKLWFRDKAYSLFKPSLDRKNSDKDYCYSNCRFIEQTENSRLGAVKQNKLRRLKCLSN